MPTPVETPATDQLSDEGLVQRVLGGDTASFETIMRRHNRRLYRAARSVVRDNAEAEDVVQEAYVSAYQHLDQFAGRASFSSWLTRIAINEALARVRRRARQEEIDAMDESTRDSVDQLSSRAWSPEQNASIAETATLLEQSIDSLPSAYRQIVMLRDVEEMSINEAAECLGITEENVKTRLHRARAMLRKELYSRAGAKSANAFQFLGARCDSIVQNVMERIQGCRPEWAK